MCRKIQAGSDTYFVHGDLQYLGVFMSYWLGEKFKKVGEGRELHCKCLKMH